MSSGTLSATLERLVRLGAQHVYGCALCCQKGFICEICDNAKKVIFPFETGTTTRVSQRAAFSSALLFVGSIRSESSLGVCDALRPCGVVRGKSH